MSHNSPKRRDFLKYGAGAVTGLMSGSILRPQLIMAAKQENGHPLAPKRAQFKPRAQNLIVVNLSGGLSHIDSFDFKPKLQADHGKTIDWRGRPFFLNASPFSFSPRGESGIMVSDLFPHLGNLVDDMVVIRSMVNDHISHGQATLSMHCGLTTIPMPSLGSWISYGLGTENPDLPSFIVLAAKSPYAGSQVWDSSFLPRQHAGTRIRPGADPVPNLESPIESLTLNELESKMLKRVNLKHMKSRALDAGLQARTATYDTADGMMRIAPELLDASTESEATLESYGITSGDNISTAWQLLTARRLVERGVRVVEVIHTGSGANWDSHGNMGDHRVRAGDIDKPLAALISDLKQRGMLDETLVVICTEFGRSPAGTENEKGRNHHNSAFTCMLAGGGTKPGTIYGKSDEYGNVVAQDTVHVHDFHATILNIMGFDHEQLTYHFGGRDFRLTDVHGRVINEILA